MRGLFAPTMPPLISWLNLTSPVLFSQSVAWLVEQGVDTFVECGTGGVLAGLVRRVDKGAVRMRIESREDLEAVVEKLAETQDA